MLFASAEPGGTVSNQLEQTTSAVWAVGKALVVTNLTNLNDNDTTYSSPAAAAFLDSLNSNGGVVEESPGLYDLPPIIDVSILRWLQYLLVPAIVSLGVAANFLALIVYMASRLRRLSCSIYLGALAITDSGFLLCLLFRWVHGIWGTTWTQCSVNYYCTGVFSFLSMTYVLSYTVERYIATCWPLQRKTWCTKRRATIVVIVSLVFALITFIPTLFMFEVRNSLNGHGRQCGAREDYQTTLKWSSVVTMCLFWIIPTFLTIFLNSRIILEMVRYDTLLQLHAFRSRSSKGSSSSTLRSSSGDYRYSMGRYSTGRYSTSSYTSTCPVQEQVPSATSSAPCVSSISSKSPHHSWFSSLHKGTTTASSLHKGTTTASSLHKGTTTASATHRRPSYKITRMLVISSSAFIVMGLPYEILKEYHYFSFDNWSLDDIIDHDYSMTYKVIVFIVYHLYYLNFGVDFFIYNVAGRNFREALGEVIHKISDVFRNRSSCQCKASELPVHV